LGNLYKIFFGSTVKDQPIYFKEDDEVEKILDYLLSLEKKKIRIGMRNLLYYWKP